MRIKKNKKLNTNAIAKQRFSIGKVDMPFLLLVLALLAIGLVMVASSSYVWSYYKNDGDSYFFIKRQLIFAVIGIIAMTGIALFDYHNWRKFAFPILVVAVILLMLVYIPGVGVKVNGARRWLNFGVQFQPSEVGKFAIILSFASYISANYRQMDKFKVGVLPMYGVLALVVGLVAFETHLSGAILILAIGVIMMFVGGVAYRYFLVPLGIGGVGLAGLMLLPPYMKSRFTIWLDPFSDPRGKGYQIVQSLYSIGSGGLLGLGLGQSRQKHLYIPEPQNDYIFAITAEELGFAGCLLIILLFVMLIWRGYKRAFHARDKFGALLVIGIVSRIAVQTILNIAVVTNAIPSTGIGLPFFSYGGTSLVILLAEIGIVLSVSRFSYLEKGE